tara:strand:+ start:2007 stop:2162 length:156 start_codon:yes stop_codon:yes gene_type:complete
VWNSRWEFYRVLTLFDTDALFWPGEAETLSTEEEGSGLLKNFLDDDEERCA